MEQILLNNGDSYKKLITLIPFISVNQGTGRDAASVKIYFGDNIDYPDYEITLMKKEAQEFKKMINNCL